MNTKIRRYQLAPALLAIAMTTGKAGAALTITIDLISSTQAKIAGTGSLDLSGLTLSSEDTALSDSTVIGAGAGYILAMVRGVEYDFYASPTISEVVPLSNSSLGGGSTAIVSSGGIGLGFINGSLAVPANYTTGADLAFEHEWTLGATAEWNLMAGDTSTWTVGSLSDPITVNVVGVPEPSSIFLLGMGCTGIFFRRFR